MDAARTINARFGTFTLITAAVMAVLIFADRGLEQSLPLPSFWYRSRVLHLPICVALFIAAWRLLKNSSENPVEGSSDPLFNAVTLYTRPGCGLCDEAKEKLQRHAEHLPEIDVVNIDDDEELAARYGDVIPVVTFDGREMFRGSLNDELLTRLIKARMNQRLDE